MIGKSEQKIDTPYLFFTLRLQSHFYSHQVQVFFYYSRLSKKNVEKFRVTFQLYYIVKYFFNNIF